MPSPTTIKRNSQDTERAKTSADETDITKCEHDGVITRFPFVVFVSPDPISVLTVSRDIVKLSERSNNLCLFACAVNALRSLPEKNSFVANNPRMPTKAFLEIAAKNTSIDRSVHGYTATDMADYLKHLLAAGHIKKFVWRTVHHFDFGRLFVRPKGKAGIFCVLRLACAI